MTGAYSSLLSQPARFVMKQVLPVNRVRRVIKQDHDVHAAQKQAVTAVELATQLFVSYFAEQAGARADGKRLQYRHFAEAVAQLDELAFLRPVVPQQQTLASVLQRRQEAGVEGEGAAVPDAPEEEEPDHPTDENDDASSSDEIPDE